MSKVTTEVIIRYIIKIKLKFFSFLKMQHRAKTKIMFLKKVIFLTKDKLKFCAKNKFNNKQYLFAPYS